MSTPKVITRICNSALVAHAPHELLRAHHWLSRPLKLVNKARGTAKEEREVYFDVTECPKMDSGALLLLFYTAYSLKRLGWEAFVKGRGESYQMVVENIKHMNQTPELRKTTTTNNGEFLCRNVSRRDQMIVELQEWATTVGAHADQVEIALWQMQISEVTTNSFQHGKLVEEPHILVAGRAHHQERTVQLAALDFGGGIPKSIAKVARRDNIPKGDGDYILHACRKGITSHSVPQNQGAGLPSLVETVQKRDGSLIILSGNGLFHASRKRRYRRNLPATDPVQSRLDGTLIVLNLNLTGR